MSKLDTLFDKYQAERSSELNVNQFGAMLRMVPGLLVATSDGVMDTKEWVLVDKMARMMGDELIPDDVDDVVAKEEALITTMKEEIRFLMLNVSDWRDEIMEALKDDISGDKKAKDFVGQAMYLFAGTSSGLSYEEERKIDELHDMLEI